MQIILLKHHNVTVKLLTLSVLIRIIDLKVNPNCFGSNLVFVTT